jgi:hypothetical protein
MESRKKHPSLPIVSLKWEEPIWLEVSLYEFADFFGQNAVSQIFFTLFKDFFCYENINVVSESELFSGLKGIVSWDRF